VNYRAEEKGGENGKKTTVTGRGSPVVRGLLLSEDDDFMTEHQGGDERKKFLLCGGRP